jgi:hypothetical protein
MATFLPFSLISGMFPRSPEAIAPVPDEPLELTNRDGCFVDEVPAALLLARRRADSADRGREGDVIVERFERCAVLAFSCVVDVALDIPSGRAGKLARGATVAHVV